MAQKQLRIVPLRTTSVMGNMVGNRAVAPAEFEQQHGDTGALITHTRSPFAINRLPATAKGIKVGAPKPRPRGNAITLMRAFFNLAGGAAGIQLVPQSATERSFLSIRNGSTSVGSVFVGFGFQPTGVQVCDYELTPGAVLLLDYRVPQNDIWVYSDTGAFGNVSFAVNQ